MSHFDGIWEEICELFQCYALLFRHAKDRQSSERGHALISTRRSSLGESASGLESGH